MKGSGKRSNDPFKAFDRRWEIAMQRGLVHIGGAGISNGSMGSKKVCFSFNMIHGCFATQPGFRAMMDHVSVAFKSAKRTYMFTRSAQW